jgi:hypothetical protein
VIQNVVGPATVTAQPGALVSVNAAGGAVTVILPPADGSASTVIVGRTDSVLSNTVAVTTATQGQQATSGNPSGAAVLVGPTIVGETSVSMTNMYLTYTEVGSVWYATTGAKPVSALDSRYGLGATAVLGSSATTTGAVAVPAYDLLQIVVRIPSLSVADIPALRFNADSGTNYWSRYITSVAGGVVLVNAQTASGTMARLSGNSDTHGRVFTVTVSNLAAATKVGAVTAGLGTGAAATAGSLDLAGSFEWVNTSNQITSVELLTAGGTATMATGTSLQIYGKNVS